ncbi:MAG: hypothetical protein EA370_06750 [Wenzhouxiangella sp.]|nr:MAG: hypothetical protein EA370_06750 [Wenzhouxiangella sp.]
MPVNLPRIHPAPLLAIILLLSANMAWASSFTGAMSGSWWNPERGGEGQFISFEQVGPRLVVILAYFTYDDGGQAEWIVGTADFEPGSEHISITMLKARGPSFGVGFSPEQVELTEAAVVDLHYIDCERLGFGYADDDQALDFELVRLIGPLDGATCGQPSRQPAASKLTGHHTGAWWDPERSGEGQFISLETLGDRQVLMFYYFTFDAHGNPDWLVGHADVEVDHSRIHVPLVTGSGARFGSAFQAEDVVLAPSGFATLDATGCGTLRLRHNGSATFGLDLVRLGGDLIDAPCNVDEPTASPADIALRELIDEHQLTGDPSRGRALPGIDAPLARLGKLLFFSKNLGVEQDTACASCHHPSLGGADGLALSVGAGAENPDLMGPGRKMADGSVIMHRNANTFFNTGLFDRGLFWDSRIESLGDEGGIRTPAAPIGEADPLAGPDLLATQARFPVVEPAEMRGAGLPELGDEEVRQHLAERLGDHGQGQGLLPPSQWLDAFQTGFASQADAEELITFDNITLALSAYQRSAIFVETPWAQYVRGNTDAIDAQAKAGARLFFSTVEEGGMHCVRCHSGDFFTDEKHHAVGFPQVGPAFGDTDADDLGRARETGLESDRHAFRTPSLLNVELTAPFGHAGGYRELRIAVAHYINTTGTVIGQLSARSWCTIPPFDTQPECGSAFATALANTNAALDSVEAARQADPDSAMPVVPLAPNLNEQLDQLTAFLKTLTDPCLRDRECFGRWIPKPEDAPDNFQLNAVDRNGNPL